MKSFQLAVVLLIVLLALKCNRCVPASTGGGCFTTVEICQKDEDVCASVIITFPKYSYFKRCMKASDAFALTTISSFQVFTCSTDRCN
uniref:Snake toxin/toxin-like domain-containing protein n=1 Tax=Anabas testudineus TaxID=64144 RepID=A0A3Q1I3M3_ANATE